MAIITLAANPTSVAADGTSTITLDVTVLDDNTGLPMAGTPVTLSADGSDTTLGSMSGTTDADGVFQTTLESTLAQTETVTVAAGDAQQTASVSFSPTLAFADANIGYTSAPVEGFAIGGLDADDNGTVTFSDGNPADNQVIAITNGVASASTVDLSGMADGP